MVTPQQYNYIENTNYKASNGGKSFYFDFEKGDFNVIDGRLQEINNLEALKLWITKILKTAKLKFGHRGCNHPVKDLEKNIVHITSQNHGYYVKELPQDMEVTHMNINDGTVEGMKHKTLPIYSVQFHPEASAGPKDSEYIFDRFLEYAL